MPRSKTDVMAYMNWTTLWFVYVVECSDGTLYTGATTNVKERIKKHNAGTGAKYTKGRGPVKLKFFECWDTKSLALKAEASLKKKTRAQKLAYMRTFKD